MLSTSVKDDASVSGINSCLKHVLSLWAYSELLAKGGQEAAIALLLLLDTR